MNVLKIIMAIIFAIVIFGNISMIFKGEMQSGWNYFALLVFIIVEVVLITKINRNGSHK
jgi:hypothetical protein